MLIRKIHKTRERVKGKELSMTVEIILLDYFSLFISVEIFAWNKIADGKKKKEEEGETSSKNHRSSLLSHLIFRTIIRKSIPSHLLRIPGRTFLFPSVFHDFRIARFLLRWNFLTSLMKKIRKERERGSEN